MTGATVGLGTEVSRHELIRNRGVVPISLREPSTNERK
jgi:hypothetical protein